VSSGNSGNRVHPLVRYAYDRGIRFFETAESYGQMHEMLGIALKGIPRDTYRLMTKVTTRQGVDPQAKIDELRKLASTEYFDIALLHYQHTPSWRRTRFAGRTVCRKPKSAKQSWLMVPPSTVCLPCAASRVTSGSRLGFSAQITTARRWMLRITTPADPET
jgi:hypothetical protein